MRTPTLVLVALLALSATGALAQTPPAKAKPAPAAEALKHGQGTGVIKAIDDKAGTITLQHQPIPAVSWPAMTMPFKIKPVLLKGLKVGQAVDFECDVQGMNATVTAIRPK